MSAAAADRSGSATTLAERQRIVALAQAGLSYAQIADRIGWSRWTVGRWVRAERREGPTRLAPRSHRPHHVPPQTTPLPIQDRIRTIRDEHPGWGARLIHRQLQLDRVPTPPSEVTIQAWLRRQGFPLVRPRSAKPLGFPATAAPGHAPVWQADFKRKGGRSM